ncbi:MAG: amidohydrolase family protein [Nitratireductor sp.]|nr:amidohydrolase family protein [Nitratireductor sp.]
MHLDGRTVRVRLQGSQISDVQTVGGPARGVILPLPVDPHVHLDKAHTITRCPPADPGLFGAIAAMAHDKTHWTAQDLHHRMSLALTDAWANGVRAMRSHIDWGSVDAPLAWNVLGEVAQDWAGRITLQRAALCDLDLLGDADHGPAIAAQVARSGGVLGAFVNCHADLDVKLSRIFALAVLHGLLLDFHVDEGLDPDARGLDSIVALTARHGLAGRVLCGHACSLSIRPQDEVRRVLDAAANARVALTVLPTTNAYLQDNLPGRSPRLRGLAPMQEAKSAGVQVLLGADNVRDPFFPYGSYDPLDIHRQAVFAAHLEPAAWVHAITSSPAQALGLTPGLVAKGQSADFIVIEAADWPDVISRPRASRHVFRAGQNWSTPS